MNEEEMKKANFTEMKIEIPSKEEISDLADKIMEYFPLLVQENKQLKSNITRRENQINEALKYIKEEEKETVLYFKYGKKYYKSDSFDDIKYILGEKE